MKWEQKRGQVWRYDAGVSRSPLTILAGYLHLLHIVSSSETNLQDQLIDYAQI